MKVEQLTWSASTGWQKPAALAGAELVLVLGDRAALGSARFASDIATHWPAAARIGCSTAGQIPGTEVFDDGAIATAVQCDHTRVRVATAPVTAADSAAAGAALADPLADPELVHVLILSEGLDINGEALVRGLGERQRASVSVSGGLSADGEHFRETLVFVDRAAHAERALELHNQTMTVTTFAER